MKDLFLVQTYRPENLPYPRLVSNVFLTRAQIKWSRVVNIVSVTIEFDFPTKCCKSRERSFCFCACKRHASSKQYVYVLGLSLWFLTSTIKARKFAISTRSQGGDSTRNVDVRRVFWFEFKSNQWNVSIIKYLYGRFVECRNLTIYKDFEQCVRKISSNDWANTNAIR